AVGIVGFFALMMWANAKDALNDANAASANAQQMDHMQMGASSSAMPLNSFAGGVPANAQALAAAHTPYEPTVPPGAAGQVAHMHSTLKHMAVQTATGVKYNAWSFSGHGAPGPILHVRQGQLVKMTLTTGGTIPHSIDFHAARIAPNLAFRD